MLVCVFSWSNSNRNFRKLLIFENLRKFYRSGGRVGGWFGRAPPLYGGTVECSLQDVNDEEDDECGEDEGFSDGA